MSRLRVITFLIFEFHFHVGSELISVAGVLDSGAILAKDRSMVIRVTS